MNYINFVKLTFCRRFFENGPRMGEHSKKEGFISYEATFSRFERGATNVLLCAELKWADVTNQTHDLMVFNFTAASCELCKKSINIEIFKSWSTGARLGCSKLAVHIFCYSLSKWTIAKSRTRKGLANSLSPQFHIKCYRPIFAILGGLKNIKEV